MYKLSKSLHQQLAGKQDKLQQQIILLYQNTLQQCLDAKLINVTQNPNMLPLKDKSLISQLDPFSVLNQLQTVLNIVLNASKTICSQLQNRELEGQYDETLLRLEREVRNLLRSEEKLRIYIECAQLRVEELKTREKKMEQEIYELRRSDINKPGVKIKKVDSNEEDRSVQKRASSPFKFAQSQPCRNIHHEIILNIELPANYEASTTNKKASGTQMTYAFQMSRENQKLRNQVQSAFKGRNVEQQKLTFDLRRTNIKSEQLDQENKYLRHELQEVNAELRKLKDQKAEEEKQKWNREVISDKNPNLMEHFRKKMDEKDKEIRNLTKTLKKVQQIQ